LNVKVEGEPGLIRLNTDGKEVVPLLKDGVWWFQVDSEHIYYSFGHSIHFTDLQGGNKKTLVSEEASYVHNVLSDDHYLYYTTDCDRKLCIKRLGKNGGDVEVVVNEVTYNLFAMDKKRLYYIGESNHLFSADLDGTNTLKLVDGANHYEIMAGEEWVYYSNLGEASDTYSSFFRIRKDGSGLEKLPEGFISGYTLTESSLVYSRYDKQYRMKIVKLDGGETELLLHDPDKPDFQ
jgi:hypothetical protein